jgi:GDPmannose 4,6-dehydratase
MPRALIVGHTGQDGRILWDQLAARGFSLVGVSRTASRVHEADATGPIDLADEGAIARLVAQSSPDQVYYLAAHHHSSQDAGAGDADAWNDSWIVHVHGFGHLLRAVQASCPSARVFYAASSRVFGQAATSPQDETTPHRPECVYGVTKAAGLLLADYFHRRHGLAVAGGILFNHESPLRGAQFVSQRVVDGLVAMKLGRADVLQVGSLDARVDWGWAPDYTRAMQLLLDGGQAGEFVVATGRTHAVRDLVAAAADHLGIDWEGRVVETAKILTRPAQALCGDASKLRAATGWAPSIDFRAMVGRLADAALARAAQ